MGFIPVLFNLIDALLALVILVLIVNVVISWLYAFGVVSTRNQVIRGIWDFTRMLTDPLLRPFRRLIPPIQGVDLSTLVLLLILGLVRQLLPSLQHMLIG